MKTRRRAAREALSKQFLVWLSPQKGRAADEALSFFFGNKAWT
jgi:hypothetical protein